MSYEPQGCLGYGYNQSPIENIPPVYLEQNNNLLDTLVLHLVDRSNFSRGHSQFMSDLSVPHHCLRQLTCRNGTATEDRVKLSRETPSVPPLGGKLASPSHNGVREHFPAFDIGWTSAARSKMDGRDASHGGTHHLNYNANVHS